MKVGIDLGCVYADVILFTAIKDKFDDWRDFLVRSLTGARTAPSYLLDKVGVIKLSRSNFWSTRHFFGNIFISATTRSDEKNFAELFF